MTAGDTITIVYRGRLVLCQVLLASENKRSLLVTFDEVLGHHAGSMAVLMDEHGIYRSLTSDEPIKIMADEARERSS